MRQGVLRQIRDVSEAVLGGLPRRLIAFSTLHFTIVAGWLINPFWAGQCTRDELLLRLRAYQLRCPSEYST